MLVSPTKQIMARMAVRHSKNLDLLDPEAMIETLAERGVHVSRIGPRLFKNRDETLSIADLADLYRDTLKLGLNGAWSVVVIEDAD
jgi:hypothetical protein